MLTVRVGSVALVLTDSFLFSPKLPGTSFMVSNFPSGVLSVTHVCFLLRMHVRRSFGRSIRLHVQGVPLFGSMCVALLVAFPRTRAMFVFAYVLVSTCWSFGRSHVEAHHFLISKYANLGYISTGCVVSPKFLGFWGLLGGLANGHVYQFLDVLGPISPHRMRPFYLPKSRNRTTARKVEIAKESLQKYLLTNFTEV